MKLIKMTKGKATILIQPDRLDRFKELGYKVEGEKAKPKAKALPATDKSEDK